MGKYYKYYDDYYDYKYLIEKNKIYNSNNIYIDKDYFSDYYTPFKKKNDCSCSEEESLREERNLLEVKRQKLEIKQKELEAKQKELEERKKKVEDKEWEQNPIQQLLA